MESEEDGRIACQIDGSPPGGRWGLWDGDRVGKSKQYYPAARRRVNNGAHVICSEPHLLFYFLVWVDHIRPLASHGNLDPTKRKEKKKKKKDMKKC